ncbi:hypothetical protein D9M68_792390 [compost metagenome]
MAEKGSPGPPLKTRRSTSASAAPANMGQNQPNGMPRTGLGAGTSSLAGRSASLLSSGSVRMEISSPLFVMSQLALRRAVTMA